MQEVNARATRFVIALLLSVLGAPAQAGRPLATEDAAVLARGDCEIESFAGDVRERGRVDAEIRWGQIGCGLGLHTQLAVGIGRERSGGVHTDIEAFAGKTFLRELTDDAPGIALAYSVYETREPGERFRGDANEYKLVVTVPVGGWFVHANLGTRIAHRTDERRTVWALAAEFPGAAGPVDLMAEFFGNNGDPAWLQVGARWAVIPQRVFLDASWGVRGGSTRPTTATLGLKFAF
jgi:hypothetical protein